MPWIKKAVLPLLAGSVILVAGALGQQGPQGSPKSAPPPAPRQPPKPDAEGAKVLAQAVSQLDLKRLGWVETAFWQQADVQGLTFTAQGKYLSGPGYQLHLDLKVNLGQTDGTLNVVSNGSTLYETVRIGSDIQQTHKWEVKDVLKALQGQPEGEVARDEFFKSQSFMGIAPLLQNIQQQMTVTKKETVRRNGKDGVKLTAEWKEDLARSISPNQNQWPPYLAEKCVIFFEGLGAQKILWPARIEWWGPTSQKAGDSLLLQMEFRDPKVIKPLTEERAAREFRFEPGTVEVLDVTESVTKSVTQVAQQMAAQKKQ